MRSQNKMRWLATFLLSSAVFLTCSLVPVESANATTREICGNGIDDDGVGGDACCFPNDCDNDGYTTDGNGLGYDPDDFDKFMQPGVSTPKGCSAGWYRTGQTNGAFSSCVNSAVTPLAEGSRNYYVDCGAGSNSNAGTYAAPFADFQCVGTWTSGSPPACHVNLTADDHVYLKGTGTCSGSYNSGSTFGNEVILLGANGTSGHPITISLYPGSTAKITPSNGSVLSTGAWNVVDGVEIANSLTNTQLEMDGAHGRVYRVHIHNNPNGNGETFGTSGIRIKADDVKIYWSDLHDNYTLTGNQENSSNWLADEAATNLDIEYSLSYYSADFKESVTRAHGDCGKFKHGARYDGSQTFTFKHNELWGCGGVNVGNPAALGFGTSSSRVKYNLVLDSTRCFNWSDYGGSPDARDNEISYNTCDNTSGFEYNATCSNCTIADCGLAGACPMNFHHNVIVDRQTTPYTADDGFVRIWNYGTDGQYNDIIGGAKLLIDNNCYFNPSGIALQFNRFANQQNGALGENSNFATWQNLQNALHARLYDVNSSNVKPYNQTNTFCANAPECIDKGYCIGAPAVGAPTTTTSSSTTTTTGTNTTSSTSSSTTTTTTTLASQTPNDIGLILQGSANFCVPGTNETYVLAAGEGSSTDMYGSSGVSRNGMKFGYTEVHGNQDIARNRNGSLDRRICAQHNSNNTGSGWYKLRVDQIVAGGTTTIHLGYGYEGGDTDNYIQVRDSDDTTVLFTLHKTLTQDHFGDAAGNSYATSAWAAGEQGASMTAPSGDHVFVYIGDQSAGTQFTNVSFVRIVQNPVDVTTTSTTSSTSTTTVTTTITTTTLAPTPGSYGGRRVGRYSRGLRK